MADFKGSIAGLNEKINDFFAFVNDTLKNFKILSLKEQLGFSSVFAGVLLVLISVILFIL